MRETKIAKPLFITAFIAALTAFLSFPSACLAAASTAFYSLETGVMTDSNVTAAEKDKDQRGDTMYNLRLTGGRRFQLGAFDSVSAQLALEECLHREYHGRTYTKAGLSAAWAHKFGIGPMKPVLTIGAGVSKRLYQYGGLDQRRYEFNARIKKRITNNVDVAASLNMESHRAKEADYNGNSRTLNLTVGVAAPAGARVELGYGQRRGDIMWYFSRATPPSWADYSDLFDMYEIPWDSQTQMISGTIIFPAGLDASVYAGIERQDTTWAWMSYPNDIFKIGYNKNFY